jgi:hypothetical protein
MRPEKRLASSRRLPGAEGPSGPYLVGLVQPPVGLPRLSTVIELGVLKTRLLATVDDGVRNQANSCHLDRGSRNMVRSQLDLYCETRTSQTASVL